VVRRQVAMGAARPALTADISRVLARRDFSP
jgi:hypothetical protein